tara:strand:+ start:253 stop:897 length:645 start_codon:yes stop_codon:yes gene_type:complete
MNKDQIRIDSSDWHHQEELEHQQQQVEQKTNQAVLAYVKTCLTLDGKVIKDSTNPHFKSGYASLDAVLSIILPACHANNLTPLQEIIETPTGIAIKTTLIHVSGDVFELLPCPIPVDKNTAQGVISASTYGRRVSLLAIFCQAPAESDDDGNAATSSPPKADPKIIELLTEAANSGYDSYLAAWKSLNKGQKKSINPEIQATFKLIIEKADEKN